MPTDPHATAVDASGDPLEGAPSDGLVSSLADELDTLIKEWDEAPAHGSVGRVPDAPTRGETAARVQQRRADRTLPAPHPATLMLRVPVRRAGSEAEPLGSEESQRPARAVRDHTLAYGRLTGDAVERALAQAGVDANEARAIAESAPGADPTVGLSRAELQALAERSRSEPATTTAPAEESRNPTPHGGFKDGYATLAGRPAFESEPSAAPPVQSLTSKAVAGAAVGDGTVQPTLDMTDAVRRMAAATQGDVAPAAAEAPGAASAAPVPVEEPAKPRPALKKRQRTPGEIELVLPSELLSPSDGARDRAPDAAREEPPRPRSRGLRSRVATGTDGPLVRSPKLQPRVREAEPTEPPSGRTSSVRGSADPTEPPDVAAAMAAAALHGEGLEALPVARPSSTQARQRAVARDVRVAIALVAAVLLAPGLVDGSLAAPWRLLANPGSANFVAAGFTILLVAAVVAPLQHLARAALLAGLGTGLIVFGTLLGRVAVSSGAFELSASSSVAFIGPASLHLLVIVAACSVPIALMWRALGTTRGVGPRIAASAALGVVLFVYIALSSPSGRAPLVAFVASVGGLGGVELVGDRVVALLALLPILTAAGAAVVFLPGATRRGIRMAADLFRLSMLLPLLALALFSAAPGDWAAAVLPLQIVALCAAGYVLLTTTLGEVLARLDHG